MPWINASQGWEKGDENGTQCSEAEGTRAIERRQNTRGIDSEDYRTPQVSLRIDRARKVKWFIKWSKREIKHVSFGKVVNPLIYRKHHFSSVFTTFHCKFLLGRFSCTNWSELPTCGKRLIFNLAFSMKIMKIFKLARRNKLIFNSLFFLSLPDFIYGNYSA